MDSRKSPGIREVFARAKWRFVFLFCLVFFFSFSALYVFGLIPIELQEVAPAGTQSDLQNNSGILNQTAGIAGEQPVRIAIDVIGIDAPVLNPQSAKVSVLDDALTKGAVHYPGSGLLGQGNMFLFGHSTGFRIVNNQAYKTFNNLKSLKKGDLIRVSSLTKSYYYSVRSVTLVDAEKALIDLTSKDKILTLSTCNTFGQKQERYVVQADYIKSTINAN